MHDRQTPPDSARRQGRLMACEGILRSEFGRRHTRAVDRAMAQLRRDASGLRAGPFLGLHLPIRRPLHAALALAASVVFMSSVCWWLFGSTMGEPVLAEVNGKGISVQRGAGFIPIQKAMALQPGDALRTGTNATLTLAFGAERTRFELGPGSLLKFTSLRPGKLFQLDSGMLDATVARQRPFHPLIITTPDAEARVVGTRFRLEARSGRTSLMVEEGKVRLTRSSDARMVAVAAGSYAVAAPNMELAALPKTGRVTREWWNGISWNTPEDSLDDPRFPSRPDGRDLFDRFEMEMMTTNRFGLRVRGYVHPPITGDYEFWLAGFDQARLFLSPDERPSGKVLIAMGSTKAPRDWDYPRMPPDGAARRSGTIRLEGGKRYYIEAIVLVPKGEGHLSVAWKRPGAERELLSGDFLSPAESKN